jgi:tetratricopeptide (TPR) repeat protein
MKYLRNITGYLPKGVKRNKYIVSYFKYFLFIVFSFQLMAFLAIVFFLNSSYLQKKSDYSKKIQNYKYWIGVADQFPNSPDIEFNAAKSSYDVGDLNKALEYADKALRTDPLFSQAQKLKNKIGG